MTPTIVRNEHAGVQLMTGLPGGSRIIGDTVQSIVNVIDLGVGRQQVINAGGLQQP